MADEAADKKRAARVERDFGEVVPEGFDFGFIPPTPFLVPGYLLYRSTTMLVGKGGAGKSLLMNATAIGVCLGIPFAHFEAPVAARNVLLLSAEDDLDEVRRRVSASCQAMHVDPASLAGKFFMRLLPDIRLIERKQNQTLGRTDLWSDVRLAVKRHRIGLLAIDPLIKASAGLDEVSNNDQNFLIEQAQRLTDKLDCALLVVDHANKAGQAGEQGSNRGASSKVDAARVVITVSEMSVEDFKALHPPMPRSNYVTIDDAKQNYSGKREGRHLELVNFEVGNGDIRPALVPRTLNQIAGTFDPDSWPHKDALLAMIRDGRPKGEHARWPWSASATGKAGSRLDVAMADRFSLTQDEARRILDAFRIAGYVEIAKWWTPNRNDQKCWRVAAEHGRDEPDFVARGFAAEDHTE